MIMLYFFSYSDAKKFAESVNFLGSLDRIPQENKIDINCRYNKDSEVLQKFNIPDFTQIVPVYGFRQEWDNFKNDYKDSYYLDFTTLAIKNLITGELFNISEAKYNSRKFRFYTFYTNKPSGSLQYFTTELKEPNAIGSPTRKKLEEYFLYVGNLNREQIDYINRAKLANSNFTKKVLSKYPDARIIKGANGWTSTIYISYGVLNFKYEASESGKFHRTYSVDYKAVPGDEEIFA